MWEIHKPGRNSPVEIHVTAGAARRARYILGAEELKRGRPDDYIVEPPVETIPLEDIRPELPTWIIDVYRRAAIAKKTEEFLASAPANDALASAMSDHIRDMLAGRTDR